ncbi:hypothetical protein COLO4_27498 [Corchorus olitorius]|uniref:Uncharacterized protein n=1 Tax=Corchorus olitorius TaxID=93759 RepID=A0A1R3HQZ6_9ROSI|nr:hypothetical protein COLO4_27498 [Corchorus olitorius]
MEINMLSLGVATLEVTPSEQTMDVPNDNSPKQLEVSGAPSENLPEESKPQEAKEETTKVDTMDNRDEKKLGKAGAVEEMVGDLVLRSFAASRPTSEKKKMRTTNVTLNNARKRAQRQQVGRSTKIQPRLSMAPDLWTVAKKRSLHKYRK